MTPEELDALANMSAEKPLSQPPAQISEKVVEKPAPKPLSDIQALMETMTAIDAMKLKFLETEIARNKLVEDKLSAQIEQRFAAQAAMQAAPAMDPVMSKAMDFILQAVMSQKSAPPSAPPRAAPPKVTPALPEPKPDLNTAAPVAPESTPTPEAVPTEAQPENAQPAPSDEVNFMENELTQEQADIIADNIGRKFPRDVRLVQEGIIPKAAAIAKIKQGGILYGGLSDANVEKIYQSIMDTDFGPGESDGEVSK